MMGESLVGDVSCGLHFTLASREWKLPRRVWCVELYRLRGLFLTTGGDESQIEGSFHNAIRTAKEQKSVSLVERAEGTYAEYDRQKASESGGGGFRLPLW
jgi:hypothetical protein